VASSGDAFESFFSELSLKSIVAILGSMTRVLDGKNSAYEPYNTFISRLIAFCSPFLSQIDETTYLTIWEAATRLREWRPEVHQVLTAMLYEFDRALQGCRTSLLSALASVTVELQGDPSGHVRESLARLLAQRLVHCDLAALSPEELQGVAGLCNLPGAIDIQTLEQYLLMALQDLAWPSTDPCRAMQSDIGFASSEEIPVFESLTLAASQIPAQEQASVQAPEDESMPKGLPAIVLKDPAYLPLPLAESIPDDEEPTIVVLSEFSGANSNGSYDVAFEVNTMKTYEMSKVQVELLSDGELVESFDLIVEAGDAILNTHSLHLSQLKDGAHQVRLSLTSLFSSSCGRPVVHRFWCNGGQMIDVPEPAKLTEDMLYSFLSSERFHVAEENHQCEQASSSENVKRTVTISTFSGSDIGGSSSRASEDGA
jgi:hypothetical protein